MSYGVSPVPPSRHIASSPMYRATPRSEGRVADEHVFVDRDTAKPKDMAVDTGTAADPTVVLRGTVAEDPDLGASRLPLVALLPVQTHSEYYVLQISCQI